jgi:hypothetical protein
MMLVAAKAAQCDLRPDALLMPGKPAKRLKLRDDTVAPSKGKKGAKKGATSTVSAHVWMVIATICSCDCLQLLLGFIHAVMCDHTPVCCLQLEGVGTGALEAAQRAVATDISELVSRFKLALGQPAPYALLADTFEEIAETTKRLIITSTLVCIVHQHISSCQHAKVYNTGFGCCDQQPLCCCADQHIPCAACHHS